MSAINVNSITGRTGTHGPVLTGVTTVTGGTLNTAALNVTGAASFSGNVSIAGTLSYEDVTDIDSVGIITAQSGIHVTGGDVKIGGQTSNYADSPLEVRSTNAGGDVAIRVTNNTTTTGSKAGIIFTNSTADYTSAGIAHLRNDNAFIFYNGQSSGAGGFDNATERLRITSAGDMGLGVTDATILDDSGFRELMIGGATEGAAIHLQDADGNVKFGAFTSDASNAAFIRTVTNHPIVFRTNNTERLRITDAGELVSTNGTLRRNVSDSSFTVSGDSASNTGANINLYGASHSSLANVFRVRTGSTERLRIASDGNISIGGMAPNAFSNYTTLTMGGAGAVTGSGIDLERSDGNIYGRIFGDNNGLQIGALQSGDYIRFEVDSGTERARITTDGLTFNGDAAAANALDDYEEGTLNWILQRNNVYAGSNHVSDLKYTKIGNRVYVSGYLYTQSTGSATGVQVQLRDNSNTANPAALPYVPNHEGGFTVTGTRTINDSYRNIAVTFIKNSTRVYVYTDDGNNAYTKNNDNVNIDSAQTHLVLVFNGSYTTDS